MSGTSQGREASAPDKSAEAVSKTPAGSDITPDANAEEWAREIAWKVQNSVKQDDRINFADPFKYWRESITKHVAAALTDAQDKALERAEKKFRQLSEQSGESPVSSVDGKWQAAERAIRSLRKGE